MLYVWTIAEEYPDAMIGEYDRDYSPNRFMFKQGKQCSLESTIPRFIFEVSVKRLRSKDDLGNNARIPLVSSRVAAILKEICGDEVELIPSEVVASDGTIDDYVIVNATNCVTGLNHRHSELITLLGSDLIIGVERAVYNRGCLGILSIARDAECLSNLLISERLYRALNASRGLGLYSLVEVAEAN